MDPAVRQRGFSLVDFLAAMALVILAMLAATPLVAEKLRSAKIRTAADQLAIDLKAARMIAVTLRRPVDFIVTPDPENAYQYTDGRGQPRRVALPRGIRIVSSSSPIQFRSNGSVASEGITVLEADLADATRVRWTVTTSVLGVSRTVEETVTP
jgi:Tfp pilus assembly protein FimT